jgi:molybdopterin-guanine dinucleotide biosynthesis protein A
LPPQPPANAISQAGFVLAGGQSSRMGHDKALALFHGMPLIQNALTILRSATPTVRIAGSRSSLTDFAEAIPDHHLNSGPLGGIQATLSATSTEWNLFLPVDMPLMPPSLLATLLQRAQLTGAPVTVAKLNGHIEPFPVVLHRCMLPLIEDRLKRGENGCQAAWKTMPATLSSQPAAQLDAVPVEHLIQAGQCSHPNGFPPLWWFQSANTPEELARLNHLAKNKRPKPAPRSSNHRMNRVL